MQGFETVTQTVNLTRNVELKVVLKRVPPPGTEINVSIDSDPQGANVVLRAEGRLRPLSATPVRTRISRVEGPATIALQKQGFERITQTVDLTQDVKLNITLKPVAPPRTEINVVVESEPTGADVLLMAGDQIQPIGQTLLRRTLTKGEGISQLVVRKPGFEDFTQRVDLGQDIRVMARLRPRPIPPPPPPPPSPAPRPIDTRPPPRPIR
jgi:hypothetical protein